MALVCVIGGGWRAEAFPLVYGPFMRAVMNTGRRRIGVLIAETDQGLIETRIAQMQHVFGGFGLPEEALVPIICAADEPVGAAQVAELELGGLFVCGGLTPGYHAAVCADPELAAYIRATALPYCGFSAGAAIASETALIGGWQRTIAGRAYTIAPEETAEDLDTLTVAPGLGLLPFAVEVHTSQWGTLSRLIHAADAGLVREGWALDEDTMLAFDQGQVSIHGLGNAYHVRATSAGTLVQIVQPGH